MSSLMELSRDQELKTEKSKPERLYCIEIGKLRQIGMSSWFGGSNGSFEHFQHQHWPSMLIADSVTSWYTIDGGPFYWSGDVVKWVEPGTSGNLYSLRAQVHPQRVRVDNSWVRRRHVSRSPVRCGPVKVTFPEHCFEETLTEL